MSATTENHKSVYPPGLPSEKFQTIEARIFHRYRSGFEVLIGTAEVPRFAQDHEIQEMMFRLTNDQRVYSGTIVRE